MPLTVSLASVGWSCNLPFGGVGSVTVQVAWKMHLGLKTSRLHPVPRRKLIVGTSLTPIRLDLVISTTSIPLEQHTPSLTTPLHPQGEALSLDDSP